MASVLKRPGGHRWIQFAHPADGRRRTIRLGELSRRDAEAVARHVEKLVAALRVGKPADADEAAWLGRLPNATVAKLAGVGLCDPPAADAPRTLAGVLGAVLEGKRDELKPEAARKLGQTLGKLLDHFGPESDPAAVTPDDASGWRASLKSAGMSVATVRTHCGNARTLWHAAGRRGLVPKLDDDGDGKGGPFAGLDAGTTARQNVRYITPDEAHKLADALPDAEWRLLFGLAYWAGLRVPSESHLLTWRDVDWERGRLHVTSPKTERYAGHERRTVPIAPELMPLLRDRFDAAEAGDVHPVALNVKNYRLCYGTVRAAAERANVAPWPALFQTLRDSCERRWAMHHPQYAVSRWIGHSITVSGKHYANVVPDEVFDRASSTPAEATGAAGAGPSNGRERRGNVSGENASGRDEGEAESEAVGARTAPYRPAPPAFSGQKSGSVRSGEGGKGGEGGIRTPDTVNCIRHFQCRSFSHSDTSPAKGPHHRQRPAGGLAAAERAIQGYASGGGPR